MAARATKPEPKRKPARTTRAPVVDKVRPKTPKPHPFIRSSDVDEGVLTDLGCPDCRGVLTVSNQGDAGFLLFRCRVGHAFSLESLVPMKEDELESALWTAIEFCEELASLHDHMATRASEGKSTKEVRTLTQRAARARRQSKELREIVAAGGPPRRNAPIGRRG